MFIIRIIILVIFPITVSCAGGNSSLWRPYAFDGANFSPSTEPDSHVIWLRSGHVPTSSKPDPESALSDILPPGKGAVAGICYTQTTGGKISRQNSFAPYPDEEITFKSKANAVFLTRTDENGYFTENLTAGSYQLFCRGVRAEFRVKQGETTFVPIRGGKRMVD